ncbi:MAG: dockerin type I repeat-containing protein [Clostridia bacterium]|nr:dockerin type I repeat-containing protein [Clostridia bacterium]
MTIKRLLAGLLTVALLLPCLVGTVTTQAATAFTSWTDVEQPIFHLGLEGAGVTDGYYTHYRYFAQEIVPEASTLGGAKLALNLTAGSATVHMELRSEVNGAALVTANTNITSKGNGVNWYDVSLGEVVNVTPGNVYYLAYWLTARTESAVCIAHGKGGSYEHPAYVWQMSSGGEVTFAKDNLVAGFELITTAVSTGTTPAPTTFVAWEEEGAPVTHLGLSTATATDGNWNNYRYIAQEFVPKSANLYGAKVAVNLTKGDATFHVEIRSEVNGAALAQNDVTVTSQGNGRYWYDLPLKNKLTVTPKQTYYLVYYLVERDPGAVCIAYGSDLGAGGATHPGYTWQMSDGGDVTFNAGSKYLTFCFGIYDVALKEEYEPFDSHTLIATGICHLGLSTANSSDPQWNNYRYIAQQFVPEQENYYGARIALNLSKGNATVHAEIRKEVNGSPLYSTDVDIVSKGNKATWYALDFGQKMTVTPGERYFLVYYLTARDVDSACVVYGTHIGTNNAVHPGYVWALSGGSNNFTDDTKRLIFGFEMIADQSEFVGTFGDVDEDDTVSSADALEVLKAVVGNVTLTAHQTTQADVDSDQSVSSVDALYVLKKVVGKIEEFPAVGKFYQGLANEVDAQIETIGDITKDNYHDKRALLKNTRQAYDMLPNASQALVTKLDVLDAAQAQWDLVKSQADTLKILFVGNSSTYFNDMPVMFSQIANANGKDVETYSVTLGGRKLIDYMVEDETTLQLKALLAEHSFDICFLQEQTTYPALNYTDYTRGLEYVMNMIGDKADRFIFYATLPRKEGQPELAANNWTPETMNQAVLSGVQKAAQTYGATCSAAGSSILYVMQNYPEINLHDTDLAHPSYRGSCLMTLTHYYTVFGEFPTDTSMLVLSNSEVAAFRATVCR